jgi:hypothetical protein
MSPRPPDQINERLTTFNEHGQLFNDNESKKNASVRYLKQIFDRETLPNITTDAGRPKIVRDFIATDDDITVSQTNTETQTEVPRAPIYGSFAAVRALRMLHQYRIGFWGDSGIIETVTEAQKPDPSTDDIADMYAKFQLFSYLPEDISPTQEEFGDMVTPSKRAANVKNGLASMGINTSTDTGELSRFINDSPVVIPTLPEPYPFATNLSQFCDRV